MNKQEWSAAFEDVFDQAIVVQGFAEHIRDDDIFIDAIADPRTGIQPEHLRYRFTDCVRATSTTAVRRDVRTADRNVSRCPKATRFIAWCWLTTVRHS